MGHPVIDRWHEVIKSGDIKALEALLDDEAVFHSPVVFTPQRGRRITTLYLAAAFQVLGGSSFKYLREVIGETDAVLEFQTEIDGITINGIDMIQWNETGKITDFKVMVRPLQAINKVHEKMGEMLEKYQKAAS